MPSLLLDGRPLGGQLYLRSWEKYPGREATTFADLCADYRRQYALGCRAFAFYATCGSDFYVPEVECWTAPGVFDDRPFDDFCAFFARECPEAMLVPQIYVGAPTWWEDAHPDELLRFADGSAEARFSAASASGRNRTASLASERWLADMEAALARLVARAEERWGDRIAAWFITSGITYEWGILGSFGFVDYSAPMRRWWDAWRADRGLPPAAPPDPQARLAGDGSYRVPARDALAADWQLCLSDLVADRIGRFCRTAKRHGGGKPTIVYYGFTLTCREGGLDFQGRYGCGGFSGGHLAFRRVLADPAVDAITSPLSYADRRLGSGDLQAHFPWGSARLAGKASLWQDDIRNWTGYAAQGIDTGWYPDRAAFLQQMRRAAARRLCGADEVYRMDLLGGTYRDSAVESEIVRLDALHAEFAAWKRPPPAEILVIVDEAAIAELTLTSKLHLQNVYRQLPAFGHTGVGWDVVLADDARTMDLAGVRLAVLLNLVRDEPATRTLTARLRAAGIAICALPGTGLVGDAGPDPAAASAVCGLPLALRRAGLGAATATWEGGGYGTDLETSHLLAPPEAVGESWARLADGGSALSVLPRTGGGFDAYAGVAPLPAELIGRLAERAGCHRFHAGPAGTMVGRHFLGLHAVSDGEHRLRLRRPPAAAPRELLGVAGWRLDGAELVVPLAAHDTALFLLPDGTG